MNKAGKIAIGVVAVGFLAAVVGLKLSKPKEVIEAIPDPTVRIENPAAGTIELKTGLTGTISAADSVYVIATGAGEVQEVYVKLGDVVEKDQPLFKIDNKQFDAAKITLDTIDLNLKDAETNLARMKVLYESGDISSQAYEQVVSGVESLRLQRQSAMLNYDAQEDATVVKAPISGLLESFSVEVHDMLSAGMVGMISGEGNKTVTFSVSERVLKGINVGDPITVEKNGMEYEGVITEVGTMVNMQTGLFSVKASLEGADALANNSMVKRYVTSHKAENVMTLPVDCVNYSNGDAFVYTYDAETGTAKKTPVEDGLIDSEKIEIESGLEFDDQVIVSWTKELYDGAPVQIAGEAAAETTAAQ